MTFLEKMVMDFDNGLHILTGSKNIDFTNIDTRPLSYQKTDTKRNPWVAIY